MTNPTRPTLDIVPGTVSRAVAWLDARNGTGREEIGLRVLKVAEEAGEAAAVRHAGGRRCEQVPPVCEDRLPVRRALCIGGIPGFG